MRQGLAFLIVLLTAWTAVLPAASEQTPSLGSVVARIDRYLDAYEPELSALVARERYVQSVKGFRSDPEEQRTLVSDFLFLRLPGRDGPWLGFRDVLEVDGRPLEHHEERLHAIVSGSPEDAATRAWQMSRESSRYNIGRLQRTINVPVCVVGWMHKRLRDRFRLSRDGEEVVGGIRTWRITFRERGRPTIVRDHQGRDVRTSGRIWVDPRDGRILQTEQEHKLEALEVQILVQFQMNDTFGIVVPSRMTERYEDPLKGRLETEAVYTDYRRFGVSWRIR